ncbi:MAG: hypothetical protein JNM24_07805 [Bdellovibrionaceae bacterium]|nr:hypothetical protein [Pseudobdellovibrionaceae bacterium]
MIDDSELEKAIRILNNRWLQAIARTGLRMDISQRFTGRMVKRESPLYKGQMSLFFNSFSFIQLLNLTNMAIHRS